MTELDKALAAVQSNPDASGAFYNVFLNTDLFIPTHDTPERTRQPRRASESETFAPVVIEKDGHLYFPVFDREERLASWAGREIGFIRMPAHALMEAVEKNVTMVLNVGGEYSKEFGPDEMVWLKNLVAGASGSQTTVPAGMRFMVGAPAVVPDGLQDALRKCLRRNPEIAAAYLGQVFVPGRDNRPGLVLVLKLEPSGNEHLAAISKDIGVAVQGVLPEDEHLDLAVFDGGELTRGVVGAVDPFYVK